VTWATVKLGELLNDAILFTDGDWVESKDQDADGEIRLIQLADIGDGVYVNKSARFMNSAAFSRLRCTEIMRGDILLARMPDPLGRCCIFPGDEKKSVTVVDICIIRPNVNKVNTKWLSHILNSPLIRGQIAGFARGATRVRISRKDLSKLTLPLPPLLEQQRIAAILDKAEEIKRKREQAIAKLDELAQSTFVEMFGDPLTNELELPTAKLEEITIKITDGEHLNPKFTEHGMPIVMAGNVLENDVELSLAKKVSTEDGHKFRKKCKPEKYDLLLVSRGATIGRMTIVNSSDEFCLMGSVILIKVNLDKVNPIYLTTLLKFPHMRSALYKTSGSSAQQAIYLKDLKNQTCLLPDIHNQNKFGEKIKSINSARKLHIQALHQSSNLSSSLQNQAFTTGFNA
jgi:type I restriction enzyme S subunit